MSPSECTHPAVIPRAVSPWLPARIDVRTESLSVYFRVGRIELGKNLLPCSVMEEPSFAVRFNLIFEFQSTKFLDIY